MNQFNLTYHPETKLFTLNIKGVPFTVSGQELEALELLCHKMRNDFDFIEEIAVGGHCGQ